MVVAHFYAVLAFVCIAGLASATGAKGRGRSPLLSDKHDVQAEKHGDGQINLLHKNAKLSLLDLEQAANRSAESGEFQMRLDRNSMKRRHWGDGPWKPAVQQKGSGQDPGNLCVEGRLLPELYLIGVPKSSTTTLALDLIFAGIWRIHDAYSDKEFHFFDGMMEWNFAGDEGLEVQRQRWLRWLPLCPASQSGGANPPRRILADFTPDYMRMVPMPERARRYGTYPPWKRGYNLGKIPPGGDSVISLPPVLTRLYGNDAIKRVKIVALLREPLARMQSAWYHAASTNFMNECVDCKAPSFQESLRLHLKKAAHGFYTDWFWTGFYGHQMERWLEHFDPSRLFVIPYGYLLHGDKDSICRSLCTHLNFNIDCDSKGQPMSHEWSHPHPPLAEDAPEDMIARFQRFIQPHNDNLVRLLAENSNKGMVLAEYQGAPGDRDAVKDWLEHGW